MKTIEKIGLAAVAAVVTVIALALCGCVNCATVRNPWSDDEVRMCYQSTAASVAVAGIVAFPQMMSDAPGRGPEWWNALTVPLGCLVLVDSVAEAAIDTVCLPVDWSLSARRKGE